MKSMRKLMRNQSGQGMTEYIIIVALIAIAAIGVVTIFGDNIRKMFGASVDALAGSATTSTAAGHSTATSTHRKVTDFASQANAGSGS
jgi:pilus assembly protein Flp/PilA